MCKRVLVIGVSNSKNLINKQFVEFVVKQIFDVEVEVLDFNDFEMLIYSIDREKELGIFELVKIFKVKIKVVDFVIIFFVEYNGVYIVVFKNVMDWIFRLEGSIWEDKLMLFLVIFLGG